jgi:hypothetical protein
MYSVTPFSPVLGSLPSPFSLLLGLLELLFATGGGASLCISSFVWIAFVFSGS